MKLAHLSQIERYLVSKYMQYIRYFGGAERQTYLFQAVKT